MILREIILLQANGKMPWFNVEDVLFVTNKWDTVRCVVSDDEQRNSTWEKLQKDIKEIWPSLNNKNIFRMNLVEVFINLFKNNTHSLKVVTKKELTFVFLHYILSYM